MNLENRRLKSNITNNVNRALLLTLLLIFIIGMFSIPAYAKTSSEWAENGNQLFAMEDYTSALEAYNMAIAINPDYVTAWYNKGITLNKLERYEGAIKAYDNAIAIDPDYVAAWNNKGNTLKKLERYEEAIKAYDNAIAIDPDYVAAWYNKGNTLHKLERYEEAIKAYDNAIAIDSDYVAAWYNKGITLHKLERYEEAIKAYDNAIAIDPDYVAAWYDKGIAFYYLGQYKEAIKANNMVIAIDPEYGDAKILYISVSLLISLLIVLLLLLPFSVITLRHPRLTCTKKIGNDVLEANYSTITGRFKVIFCDKLIYKSYFFFTIRSMNKRVISVAGEKFFVNVKGFWNPELVFEEIVKNDDLSKTEEHIINVPNVGHSNDLKHESKTSVSSSWNMPPQEIEHLTSIPKSTAGSTAPEITSAFGYKGATIQYKIKVENPTPEPIGDIKVNLYVPDVFLVSESTKTIVMLKPSEAKTVTFEIRPTGECGDCEISGKVVYYDYSTKKTSDIDIPAKNLSIVCPMLRGKEISESEWHNIVGNFVETEESTKDIDMPAETLFIMVSRIVKDMHMHPLNPEITNSPQLYNGVARFYGEGVKGLKYAAQVEVVGGAKKSKLILKTWAEKEEALTGFYHGLLDEIEKRVQVKGYINDSIVQNFHHHGDNIGTQVKDSFVYKSNVGSGETETCPQCGKESVEGERFCSGCGMKFE